MRKLVALVAAFTLTTALAAVIIPNTGAYVDKTVNIQISGPDASGQYTIADPGSVSLSKAGKDKVKFCVDYSGSTAPGTVTVGGFTLSSDPDKKNPFGNRSDTDNAFDIAASTSNKCSKVSVDINNGAELGSYKYTITAKDGSGATKGVLDPDVILGR